MNKLIAIFLITTGLFAQNGLTIVGGLNLGNVKFNDSDMADEIDLSMKMGFSVSAEMMTGPLKVGAGFIQRGEKLEVEFFESTLEGSDTYNYLTGYALYPYSFQPQLSAFGGLQVGKFIGGETEVSYEGETESEDLEGDDFELDYGLLLGMDYMLNDKMGIRASYYFGLADIAKDVDSDYNFKHVGIGISLLLKM